MVTRPKISKDATTVSDPAAYSMATEWDTVYGAGFYVSKVLGANFYARAVVKGDKGTVLNMETSSTPSGEVNGGSWLKGVARDNHDSVFKLVF